MSDLLQEVEMVTLVVTLCSMTHLHNLCTKERVIGLTGTMSSERPPTCLAHLDEIRQQKQQTRLV